MHDGDLVWRERALRSAVLAGDERAWQTWYDESFGALYAYVRWRCAGLHDLADDVTQECWLIAVRRVRDFDPERGSFASWLRGIAARVVQNHLRRRVRQGKRRRPLGDVASSAKQGHQQLIAEQIAQALADLPERYEAVLQAKYVDQRSVADIASAWNETPKAIESLLTRARQAFRVAYEELEGNDG